MSDDPVEALIEDHLQVIEYLLSQGQASYASAMQGVAPKVGLLAAASWLEAQVMEVIHDFYREHLTDVTQALEFVRIAALERKYHTLFEWDKRNANAFFGKFGDQLKAYATQRCADDRQLSADIAAFMELGSARNKLVHGNYATAVTDKTVAEVLDLYAGAKRFVARLPTILRMTDSAMETNE